MARRRPRKKSDEEKYAQMKVYIPQTIYAQIKRMAITEDVTYSHVAAQIIRAFFRGVPQGYGDPTQEALRVYHSLTLVWTKPKEIPEKERLSRMKIGEHDPEPRGYATKQGLSSRPELEEDNGPSLNDLTPTRKRLRNT